MPNDLTYNQNELRGNHNGKIQRKYDMKYKIQTVKSAKELDDAKAAAELGISENTMYAWTKAAGEGRLNTGSRSYTPETALSLAEDPAVLTNP